MLKFGIFLFTLIKLMSFLAALEYRPMRPQEPQKKFLSRLVLITSWPKILLYGNDPEKFIKVKFSNIVWNLINKAKSLVAVGCNLITLTSYGFKKWEH